MPPISLSLYSNSSLLLHPLYSTIFSNLSLPTSKGCSTIIVLSSISNSSPANISYSYIFTLCYFHHICKQIRMIVPPSSSPPIQHLVVLYFYNLIFRNPYLTNQVVKTVQLAQQILVSYQMIDLQQRQNMTQDMQPRMHV